MSRHNVVYYYKIGLGPTAAAKNGGMRMRLISWNVNGLRACMGKGFEEFFHTVGADCFCLQETKLQPGQLTLELPGYRQFWSCAEKKGYSGTAIFTRREPLSVRYAQDGLKRIDHRMAWDDAFRAYLQSLDAEKPVVACGDLNVAHQPIDLKNPGPNRGNAGFSDEERGKFSELLAAGFTDTFRYRNPDLTGAYSWWSYRFHARENNAGWRIDYFLVSDRLRPAIEAAPIYHEIYGSDHCPVGLELKEELL